MVTEVKRARLDPQAAAASIEAIVHALVPLPSSIIPMPMPC